MDVGPTAPDWINAAAGVGTLIAALGAGFFAWRAAVWTKAQAQSAASQVVIAESALEVARQDAQFARRTAEQQRAETEAAARNMAQSRIDADMPSVLARAHPGWSNGGHRPPLEVGRFEGNAAEPRWTQLTGPTEFRRDERVVFRVNAVVRLQNFSKHVAQVAVIDPAGGETDVSSGSSALVLPGDESWFRWSRFLPLHTFHESAPVDPTVGLLNLLLWVRDLGMSAYDEVRFNASTFYYRPDGSRFVIGPPPPWTENVGQPVRRVYEHFPAPDSDAGVPEA